ncbi:MAG: chitobiase/beta-hexosaminidase C-terminal domain-containing protein [Gammaproteobacteria bacterium]|nr:chitobiase/beta-hexosaminidase C-terminal domain-containing protein [Gammaproteobacteria bacterium]
MRTPTICVLLSAVLISLASAGIAIANEAEERDPTQPVGSHSFTALNQTFAEDFDDYRGSAGTLPDSLFVSWDDRISEPFQGVNTGAFTAYSSDGSDHAFGIREREPVDLRDGRLFFAFTNDSDEPVTEIRVSYDVEAWFIGDRRNRVRLKYDTLLESSERATFEVDIVSTDNPSSETVPGTDVDGSLPEHRTSIDVVINLDDLDDGTGTMFGPLAPGETAYLRWQVSNADDDSGSLRSGLAINNLSVTFPGPVDENGDQPFSFVTLGQMLSEDFNDYRGSAETLPDHFSVIWDESRTSEPFQGVNTGGFTAYTFDDVDHAFGIREREPVDLRDARLLLAFRNDTGSDITHIEVSYDVETWFIGDRRNRVRLKYDTLLESSERDIFETDIVSTDNPSSTTTPDTDVNGSLAENREAVTVVIDLTTLDNGTGSPFGPLAHGETAFLRWQVSNADGDGGNLRSGLAIDNVVVMPIDPAAGDPDPVDPDNGGEEPVTPLAPEFSPAPGTFTGSVDVSITSPTETADIRYTLDGSEPTLASLALANGGSVTLDATATLKAIAVIDENTSASTEGDYTITLAEEDEGRDPTQAVASHRFSGLNQTFIEDFDGYRGSPDTLADSLFVSWDERISEPFQGVNTGGFTAYTSDGDDHAFGIREREPVDLRDGRLFFAFTNDSDEPVTEIRVSYDVEAWFIGDRRNRVRLKYDTLLESSERATFEVDIVSTDNPSSETVPGTDVDGSLPEHRTSIDVVINLDDLDDGTGTMFGPLAPGETAYLRWQVSNADDDSGSLRSGLAINNLSVTFPGPVDENGDQPFSFVTLGQMLSEDFNDYRGSAETLPDHFSVIWDESRTSEPFQGVNTGGFTAYTFDDVDHAFGIREREPVDLRDARLLLAFRNDTGSDITHIEVSYDVETWFIGDRRNRVRLKYDTLLESSERDIFETDIVSTDNPSSTTTPDTDVNGSLAENREAVTVVIDLTTLDNGTGSPFGPLAHGETAFLRWQVSNADGDGGNLRSGLAIDNVVVMPIDPAVEDPDPADPTDPTDPSDPGNGGDDPIVPQAPAFSPAAGEFDEPVTVTLTSSSEGATIFFTLDGTPPTTASDSVANGGTVTIDATATLSAIAVIDDAASDTATGEFTITLAEQEPTLAAPELSPPGGTFVGSVTVTLTSATEDALIRFTTDGSDPDADSQSVESGGTLTFNEDTELRAAAQVDGEISEVTVGNYVIQEGIADDSLANGGFGNLNPRPQTVSYVQRGGPPGWRLVVEARAENDGGTVETGDAFAGEAAFSFNLLSAGFSDNKLEQCVPIDASRRVDIAYRVRADTPDDDASGLRVRINPNFFASFDDCTTATSQDSGGSRLSGGRNNDDVDFDLGPRGNEWILRSPAEDAGLRYEVADLPQGTTWMRLSIRSRDRSGISPAPRVRLDDIRVTQGTSAVNLLVNGSFEQIELRDRDFLAGGSGWFVDRGGDASRRAAAGPMDFALLGSNVFYFEDLSENFGDSRLDQCVALNGEALQPAVFVRTGEPAEGLSLRINADFYASADCEGEADEGPRIRQDFELDMAANTWTRVATDESRSADDYGDAQSVLLSLRMRDRSDLAATSSFSSQGLQRLGTSGLAAAENGNGGGGSLSRRVFIDAVSLVSGAAAPEPEPEPDEPPGADPDPAPAPPGPLRSSGCSASGQPGPFDPTLWVLALLAGLALFRRRRPAD